MPLSPDTLLQRSYPYEADLELALRSSAEPTQSSAPELDVSPWWNALWDLLQSPALRFVMVGVLVLLALWLLHRMGVVEKLRELLALPSSSAAVFAEQLADTNIHRDDLEDALQRARAAADYDEVVHLSYLLALRALAHRGAVQWTPSQTPSDYVRTLLAAQHPQRLPMQRLTHLYLHTRFGHFAATAAVAAESQQHCDTLQKGGKP